MPDISLSTARDAVLVSSSDVRASDVVVVEARRGDEDAPATIAGARVAVLGRDLAGPPTAEGGRFPLPRGDALADTLRRWGIDPTTPVVVAASTPEDVTVATRAWFVLRAAGVSDVRVLDGGASVWGRHAQAHTDAADAAEAYGDDPRGHDVRVWSIPGARTLDASAARELGASGVLVDARPASAFEAGRIPGAVNAPGSGLFRDGLLIDDDALRVWAEELGVTGGADIGAYCGGGVAASAIVFALAAIGIDAGLYVGSWSAWSADPTNPVER
ncbi:rhodanese-like domain-containing protein [Microbacterium sp. BWT-B31]|uniref:sulfurtransferase n=1 Tax=Microbacterium sp. BWT-B31 TaxID=3232072 RepID=UPI0035272D22